MCAAPGVFPPQLLGEVMITPCRLMILQQVYSARPVFIWWTDGTLILRCSIHEDFAGTFGFGQPKRGLKAEVVSCPVLAGWREGGMTSLGRESNLQLPIANVPEVGC